MEDQLRYQQDIDTIIAKRYDNGGDYWAGADGRIFVGNPYSTIGSALLLSELGVDPSSPILKSTADVILGAWREDGRFKIAPTGAIYPCQTVHAAHALCTLGYAGDSRLAKTFEHLLDIQYTDGGWRCNKFFYGRGPETEFSNPGPTLDALGAFRLSSYLNADERLDKSVEFFLNHWEIRKPIGPCHYGMGTQFMKIEYPLLRYNLFGYVYVLSFYKKARQDARFLSALGVLRSKVTDGRIVIEYTNKGMSQLVFCRQGMVSDLAGERYAELMKNIGYAKQPS